MSGGANLSSAAVFNPGSIHASRAYVDAVLSGEAGNRSAADDALTIAIQDVDTKLSVHAAGSSHVTQQEKSAWNSKCPLEDGKVPAANLPSFVDDVVEAGDSTLFPRTGETGKIYVARDTNKTYRWGGSGYVEISQSLALGETSSTAYPGNKGKANAEAIASEASRAHRVEELILQAISEFLKDASVSQDGKTLTITKKNGTTVQFQGGSSAWDDITDKPQSFTPSAHASSHANGGADAITPEDIGAFSSSGGEITGDVTLAEIPGMGGGKRKITVYGSKGNVLIQGGYAQFKPRVIIGGVNAATVDQLPYSSTSTPADRTCATVTVASTGASVAIPKPSTESKITAFCVYLDMTALTGTAPTVGFKYADNTDADILTRGGEGLSYETGAVNAVFFIQCGTKYIASAQVYK